jgi:hypothetical protein
VHATNIHPALDVERRFALDRKPDRTAANLLKVTH